MKPRVTEGPPIKFWNLSERVAVKVDRAPMLQTLNLPRRATPRQVQNAYRQLARKWHPDRCVQTGESPERAATKMREINLAREMLLADAGRDHKAGITAMAPGPTGRSVAPSGSGRYPDGSVGTAGPCPGGGPSEGTVETPARSRSRDLVKVAGHLLAQGRLNRSLAVCNQALQFDRGNAAAYNRRGAVFKATGKYAWALKDFSRAIKLGPDYVDALVNRGDTHFDLGQYTRAMADYDNAIRIGPEGTRAFRGRARLLFKTRNYERAIADMRRALAL